MAKIANFRRFLGIGVSATFAEYSVPNIRPIFAEYSAEYSVFGRTLVRNYFSKKWCGVFHKIG